MSRLLAVSVLTASIGLALAPAHAANAPDISAQRLSQIVRTLSSDEFEGRAPATAGAPSDAAATPTHAIIESTRIASLPLCPLGPPGGGER